MATPQATNANGISVLEGPFTFTHVAANIGATNLKNTPAFLHAVSINTKGATSNLLTLYDSVGGTTLPIAAIDTTALVTTMFFDIATTLGLTYVLAAGTAADLTIIWI
jgi:hypothetical protein